MVSIMAGHYYVCEMVLVINQGVFVKLSLIL